MRLLACLALVAVTGCAGPFPVKPEVAWINSPTPVLIPQAPDPPRPGFRALTPAPVPAPMCVTDADHLALEAYFEQVAAWRGWRLK